MSKLTDALTGAVAAAARRPDIPIDPYQAPLIASAVAQQLPAPQALESLWPQLARYAVTISGSILVGQGWVDAADWQMIAGAVLALAPPVWRTVTTLLARRKAA